MDATLQTSQRGLFLSMETILFLVTVPTCYF